MTTTRVSIRDVAKAAGVSQAAVSRVINKSGYISEEKRETIRRVIRELGYRPNVLARSLVKNRSRTIGLCIPYLDSPFIANLMAGVEIEAEKHGYDVFMCHTKEDPEGERKAVTRMLDRQVEGIIIAPVIGEQGVIKHLMRMVPTIVFLRKPQGVTRNLVLANDYAATEHSFAYLLEKGHRRIGVIAGPPGLSTIGTRLRAVEDSLRKHGIRPVPSLVTTAPLNYRDSYLAAKKLLRRRNRPTAIYPLHYWGAAALLWAVYEMGLRIPEDLSVVAYESFENWNLMATLKFAANIFPAVKMGEAAMSELHNLISHNQLFMADNIEIAPEFLVRDSVSDLTAPASTRRHKTAAQRSA